MSHFIRSVNLEIDDEMYSPEMLEGKDPYELRLLAAVSTAYNILAETAAENVMGRVNDELRATNPDVKTDAEVFEEARRTGVGATSYRELAYRSVEGVMALGDVYASIERLTAENALLAAKIAKGLNDGDAGSALLALLGLNPTDGGDRG